MYPFVDIWMSRKSWTEARIKILSVKPAATSYDITRCGFYSRDLMSKFQDDKSKFQYIKSKFRVIKSKFRVI